MRGLLSLAAVAVLLFSFAAPAFAQSSSFDAYTEQAPKVLGQVEGNGSEGKQSNGTSPNTNTGSPTPVTKASGDTLPFTGFEVGGVALLAVALVGTGVGLRRIARPPVA